MSINETVEHYACWPLNLFAMKKRTRRHLARLDTVRKNARTLSSYTQKNSPIQEDRQIGERRSVTHELPPRGAKQTTQKNEGLRIEDRCG